MKKQHITLYDLIGQTESMDDKEKQFWRNIIGTFPKEQIEKFRNILEKEQEALKVLNERYDRFNKELDLKHSEEWKNFYNQKSRVKFN